MIRNAAATISEYACVIISKYQIRKGVKWIWLEGLWKTKETQSTQCSERDWMQEPYHLSKNITVWTN